MSALLDLVMRRRARALVDRLAPLLPPGGRLLDVGSGTGHNAAALLDRGLCASVTPVDVVDLRITGPEVVVGSLETLSFPEKSFDLSLLLYVLQYPIDPADMLRSCARVSRDGVLVVQSTYDDVLGLGLLGLNELAWGPGAWAVARALGWVRPARFSLATRRLMSERRLLAAIDRAGLRLERRLPCPWRSGHVRSDAWVLR